jgi:hypothetical protein
MVANFSANSGEFTGDLQVDGDTHLLDTWVDNLTVGNQAASWQSYTARYCTLSGQYYFLRSNTNGGTTAAGTVTGRIVSSYTDKTIYYLGRT